MRSRVFAPKNSFMDIFSKVVDTLILSVLWLVCSIPVFSVGAASGALYYAYHKAIRQNRGYAWKEFFAAFKANFKQATGIWMLLLVFTLMSLFACYALLLWRESVPMAGIFLTMGAVIVGFTVMWCLYVFAYLSRFENTVLTALKNSAVLVIANLPWSVLLLGLFAAAAVVTVLKPAMCIPVIAVYIWLENKILERVFRRLMTEEELRSELELEQK